MDGCGARGDLPGRCVYLRESQRRSVQLVLQRVTEGQAWVATGQGAGGALTPSAHWRAPHHHQRLCSGAAPLCPAVARPPKP